jgi:hypothetical protein
VQEGPGQDIAPKDVCPGFRSFQISPASYFFPPLNNVTIL